MPRFKIVCPDDNSELIEPELQERYCSGVRMLLYLTKYSRPDISNVVKELSKCMDGATIGSHLEMLRVVKFVLGTNTFCSKVCPKIDGRNYNFKVFCDSDWAGDLGTEISVTGLLSIL
jgi:hypothetical protein